MVPHKATIDTKTRSFQYKLLNRIVYINKSLFKMKLIDSPMCTFCNLLEESLEHLFCNCSCSKEFWMSVVSWLNGVGIDLDLLNECDILFGLLHTRSHWLLLNHIIIMGKQVIYQSRLKKCKPLLTHLKNKLKNIAHNRMQH